MNNYVDRKLTTDSAYSSNNYTAKKAGNGGGNGNSHSSNQGGGGNNGGKNKIKVNYDNSGEKKKTPSQNESTRYPCDYCGQTNHRTNHCRSIECQVCGKTGKCWPNQCRSSEQVKVNATASESDGYEEDDEVDDDSNAKLADTFKLKNPKPNSRNSSSSGGKYRKVSFANGN